MSETNKNDAPQVEQQAQEAQASTAAKKKPGLNLNPQMQLIAAIVAGVIIVGLLITTICIAVTGGKTKTVTEKAEAFAAPQNVSVSTVGKLTWSAVEGASAGYTVRINGSEDKIYGVSAAAGTTVDLTQGIIMRYFASGANTLDIKTNAVTGGKTESAYSTAATYNFNGSNEEEEEQLIRWAKVTGLKIEGDEIVWNAVTGASAYIMYTEEADSVPHNVPATTGTEIRVDLFDPTVKADLKLGTSSVEILVKVAADATHRESVPVGVIHIMAEESETVREAKKSAATAKLTTLLAMKTTMEDEEDLPTIEETIAAIEEFNEAYDTDGANYPDYVKTHVATQYATLQTNYATAKGTIEDLVDETKSSMQTDIDIAYSDSRKPTKEEWEALQDWHTFLTEGLAEYPYAQRYWNATYASMATALSQKIAAVEQFVIDEQQDLQVFAGAGAKITILYRATNVLGEGIQFTASPALTLSVNDTSVVGAQLSPNMRSGQFTGVYVYTSSVTPNGDELKVAYGIGDANTKTVTYTLRDGVYFMGNGDTVNNAFENNSISIGGAPKPDHWYMDIYDAGDIDRSGVLPEVTGFPLIKGLPMEEAYYTESNFRMHIARNPEYADLLDMKNPYTVRFVAYEMSGDGSNVTLSYIKKSTVSADTYTLDLTQKDKLRPILYATGGLLNDSIATDLVNYGLISGVTMAVFNNGTTDFSTQFQTDCPTITLNDGNVADYLELVISAWIDGERVFAEGVPFGASPYNYYTFMYDWAKSYFTENSDATEYNMTYELTLSVRPTQKIGNTGADNPLYANYGESGSVKLKINFDAEDEADRSKTDKTEDLKNHAMNTGAQIAFEYNGGLQQYAIIIVRKGFAGNENHGALFDKGVDRIELNFWLDNEQVYTAYMFKEGEQLKIYKTQDKQEGTALTCEGTLASGLYTFGFNSWVNTNYGIKVDGSSEANFDYATQDWKFATRVVLSDNSYYLFQGGFSEPVSCPATTPEP